MGEASSSLSQPSPRQRANVDSSNRRIKMKRGAILLCSLLILSGFVAKADEWPQWGQNARHTGTSSATGQRARQILADVVYDPFVEIEKNPDNGDGDLLVHYQVPLIDGDDIYMMFKAGTYTNITTWETQTWGEKKYR